ncbi:hypothetical protein KAU33_10425 [Candidatus Dependentiae bacterium]|nr:hypothetical protein [Candidatus Dependentiae bacterium]
MLKCYCRFSEDVDFTAVDKDKILSNWQVAKQQQEKATCEIYCTEEVSGSDIEKLINNFKFNEIAKNAD